MKTKQVQIAYYTHMKTKQVQIGDLICDVKYTEFVMRIVGEYSASHWIGEVVVGIRSLKVGEQFPIKKDMGYYPLKEINALLDKMLRV